MFRIMLKSKIHRATVTGADLQYEGSITIDKNLLDAADISLYEQVQIYNITNGERFETYVIEGERDSGEICLNGAAARLVQKGDLVIIASYIMLPEEDVKTYKPKYVFVNKDNRQVNI